MVYIRGKAVGYGRNNEYHEYYGVHYFPPEGNVLSGEPDDPFGIAAEFNRAVFPCKDPACVSSCCYVTLTATADTDIEIWTNGDTDILSVANFGGMVQLRRISLPEVKYVDTYCFANCQKLSCVDIPAANKICPGAFANCESMKELHVESIPISTLSILNSAERGSGAIDIRENVSCFCKDGVWLANCDAPLI